MIEPVRVKAGKKMNTKQFLSDILDEFNKIDYVKPEDIPNIDLYMDQVTTFMDSQLCLLYTSPSPRDVEESRMPSSA